MEAAADFDPEEPGGAKVNPYLLDMATDGHGGPCPERLRGEGSGRRQSYGPARQDCASIFAPLRCCPRVGEWDVTGSAQDYAASTTVPGSVTTYHHTDHLSTRLITDSNANVVEQKGHFPFGEIWYEGSINPNKRKFTTYERDSESGNDYAIFRSHIPRYGRFNRPDPLAGSIADPQSLNRYAYVLNDPINLTDPLGLYAEREWPIMEVT